MDLHSNDAINLSNKYLNNNSSNNINNNINLLKLFFNGNNTQPKPQTFHAPQSDPISQVNSFNNLGSMNDNVKNISNILYNINANCNMQNNFIIPKHFDRTNENSNSFLNEKLLNIMLPSNSLNNYVTNMPNYLSNGNRSISSNSSVNNINNNDNELLNYFESIKKLSSGFLVNK